MKIMYILISQKVRGDINRHALVATAIHKYRFESVKASGYILFCWSLRACLDRFNSKFAFTRRSKVPSDTKTSELPPVSANY